MSRIAAIVLAAGAATRFGSPKQRAIEDGDVAGAWERTTDSYRPVVPDLAARNVGLWQEALAAPEGDFLMACAEAAEMAKRVPMLAEAAWGFAQKAGA